MQLRIFTAVTFLVGIILIIRSSRSFLFFFFARSFLNRIIYRPASLSFDGRSMNVSLQSSAVVHHLLFNEFIICTIGTNRYFFAKEGW